MVRNRWQGWRSAGWLLLLMAGGAVAGTRLHGEESAETLSAPADPTTVASVQKAFAAARKLDVEVRNTIGMTLVLIPPATYRMGNLEPAERSAEFARAAGLPKSKPEDFADELPAHAVRITQAFRLARTEVTRDEFAAFVKASGYRTEAEADPSGGGGGGGWGWDADRKTFRQDPGFNWRETGFPQSGTHPVVNVSWNDAQAFCRWLSDQENRAYRLPTEAEWELACRAGTIGRYAPGDDPETLATVANVADGTAREAYPDWPAIRSRDGFVYTAPVGSFPRNPFGLADMHGNVWEWCADFYDAGYYATSPEENPPGPLAGTLRVSRGGAWSRTPVNVRSSVRRKGAPSLRHINIGFRPAMTIETK